VEDIQLLSSHKIEWWTSLRRAFWCCLLLGRLKYAEGLLLRRFHHRHHHHQKFIWRPLQGLMQQRRTILCYLPDLYSARPRGDHPSNDTRGSARPFALRHLAYTSPIFTENQKCESWSQFSTPSLALR